MRFLMEKSAIDNFKSEVFPMKEIKGKGFSYIQVSYLKKLTPKQILERLANALTQVKEGNTLQNLQNEIHRLIYLLYQAKEITTKNI